MNLFEPRWLAMMDVVTALAPRPGDIQEADAGGSADTPADTPVVTPAGTAAGTRGEHPLVGRSFGTVHAVNRYYAAVGWGSDGCVQANLVISHIV